MRLKNFVYDLPKNLIAQRPVSPRDHSRLLVLDRKTGRVEHRHFYDMINFLKADDVLVLNNTKVMRARLIGKKAQTGGKIEVFLLRKNFIKSPPPPPVKGGGEVWQCLIGGKGRKEKLNIYFAGGLKAEIIKNNHDGTWGVKFNKTGPVFMKLAEKIGQTPLPPYIKGLKNKKSKKQKNKNYQTVFADNDKLGSVAAPTAGLHFTKRLIGRLKKKGVQIEYITLQVGFGTFAPVKVEDITKHKMHEEWVEISGKALKNIIKAKTDGRRIIAVGTTSVRALESFFKNYKFKNYLKIQKLKIKNYSGWTDIFIYPGYKFKIVDAMITNFHLPKSTLLMLASAFAKAKTDKFALGGRDKILKAYEIAIRKKYRFYSYGDAMMII